MPQPEKKEKKYQSNAEWPQGVYDYGARKNVSTDLHFTEEEAQGICNLLTKHGFGGQGKHYPVRTWVSESQEAEK